jgi:tetratricopeptide (TPR) repeat protein
VLKQTRIVAPVLCSAVLCSAAAVSAAESPRDGAGADDLERQQAFQLYREHKMPEAATLLEKVIAQDPNDVAAHEALGVALASRAATQSDPGKARADRLEARKELLRAKELGDTSDLCRIILTGLPESGEIPALSEKPEVNALLQAGEAAFAAADWQKALAAYSGAWDLDHSAKAALYVGDTYFSLKDMDRAGEWYAKAIELEPNSETAYRYWGDALMGQGKMKEARAKYIDGVVADPYQAASVAGLRKWLTRNKLEFKKIPITLPQGPSVGKDGKMTINVDASILNKSAAAAAWLTYSATRGLWQEGQFLKAGQPHVLPLDTDAAVLLGRMNETPALRNFLVHDPATKKTKTGADLAIASIAITRKAVMTTANCSDFLFIHRHYPLPGLYDPFQNKWHVKPP